jgi:hypothetical protein
MNPFKNIYLNKLLYPNKEVRTRIQEEVKGFECDDNDINVVSKLNEKYGSTTDLLARNTQIYLLEQINKKLGFFKTVTILYIVLTIIGVFFYLMAL